MLRENKLQRARGRLKITRIYLISNAWRGVLWRWGDHLIYSEHVLYACCNAEGKDCEGQSRREHTECTCKHNLYRGSQPGCSVVISYHSIVSPPQLNAPPPQVLIWNRQ